jgi:hypothetical protein
MRIAVQGIMAATSGTTSSIRAARSALTLREDEVVILTPRVEESALRHHQGVYTRASLLGFCDRGGKLLLGNEIQLVAPLAPSGQFAGDDIGERHLLKLSGLVGVQRDPNPVQRA